MNSQTIPAWFIALCLIYTGVAWAIASKNNLKVNMGAAILTYFLQSIMFGWLFQFGNLDIELRGFYSRVTIILICISQSLPITLAQLRSTRGRHG